MQDSTRSKLTLFARLWAVSTILYLGLSIVAVAATMNDNNDLMGVAVLGTVVLFIVQLGQLVAGIVLRRWWCVAGSVLGLLVSIFVTLCCIVALAAGQYRAPSYIDEEVVATDSIEYTDSI